MATESAIKNLKKQIAGMERGNIPCYTMPIKQAKQLELEGYIIRGPFGSIELTAIGKLLLCNVQYLKLG